MRTLVLGGEGMLGRAVASHWRRLRTPVLALGRAQADLTDPKSLAHWTREFAPEVIVNCAAFTAVDACEEREEHATRINGHSVGSLAELASEHGAALIHVSSDYVFDGEATRPIPEDAATGPRSAYGRGKLLGEEQALSYERATVVRASWLFGPGGGNFVATIRRLLTEGKTPLRVVDDQIGRPTYTPFLARALWDLSRLTVRGEASGLVHYGNREATSWHGLATEIARIIAPGAEVLPVATSEFPRPAHRPAYSVLDVARFEAWTGRVVEPWLLGLVEYLESESSGTP